MGKGNFSYKKAGVSVSFFGFGELLEKIDEAEGNIVDAVVRATKASSKPIKRDLLSYMERHKLTGGTESSFVDVTDIKKGYGRISYKIGFDIKKGGLPALFLDIGTPTIKPSFFVYYAFMSNEDEIKEEQEKALKEALSELL